MNYKYKYLKYKKKYLMLNNMVGGQDCPKRIYRKPYDQCIPERPFLQNIYPGLIKEKTREGNKVSCCKTRNCKNCKLYFYPTKIYPKNVYFVIGHGIDLYQKIELKRNEKIKMLSCSDFRIFLKKLIKDKIEREWTGDFIDNMNLVMLPRTTIKRRYENKGIDLNKLINDTSYYKKVKKNVNSRGSLEFKDK